MNPHPILTKTFVAAAMLGCALVAQAAPVITRLTPPSALFSFGDASPPVIARFLSEQRFDLQCTVSPEPGATITSVTFEVDGRAIPSPSRWSPAPKVTLTPATVAGLPAGTTVATLRAYSNPKDGIHRFKAIVRQNNGTNVTAEGNFEIIGADLHNRSDVKNIIIMIGDGLGSSHRTAARIMSRGIQMGKANAPLAMDTFPVTGMVMTASLNSIITDSSPGAACYSTGNKSFNNQQGVFPDDTTDAFDNPRVELIGELLARVQNRSLGIVTTADVFDATPGAFGTHTSNRGAGTGICDQYLDEAVPKAGLKVLLGGGRKWFLPKATLGSVRSAANDYVLPTELTEGWGIATGAIDEQRDLIGDFQKAGFAYAPTATALNSISQNTTKLLGLFSLSNMNVANDKINGRRGNGAVVNDYGFPDQPMLDEMTDKALNVLSKDRDGFVLMVEGASIDKQAHNMDTERWILDTIEFDRAVAKAQAFAASHKDTIVIITADHECGGVAVIGASLVTDADLTARAASGGGAAQLREPVVGLYEAAGFPVYTNAPDGYPVTTDVDRRMLIGYASNADRYEDWRTNPQPLRDSQQPFNNQAPLNTYPNGPLNRDVAGNFLLTGQIPGATAAHTGGDIQLSAFGDGAEYFSGVFDNTEVFFKLMDLAFGCRRY